MNKGIAGKFVAIVALASSQAAAPAAAQEARPVSPQGLAAPVTTDARPNVLVWMLDDVGFGQIGSFGGLIDTPNIDRIANKGLRYTNHHTPPMCSPSRAAFLTGRNPHTIHMGGHGALTRPEAAYDGQVPPAAGTIAEYLRQGGYRTYAIGKWDHLPTDEVTGSGPYARWPLGQGFDRFYGFLAADTNKWSPVLFENNRAIPTPQAPGYHFAMDMADRAIGDIRAGAARGNRAPFFLYWATSEVHAPHHAPADWIARYRGRFDMGWDELRKQVLQRQIARHLAPASTKLGPRPDGMAAWNTLSRDQKRLYARQMEVFAASLSYADAQFGRILDELEARGELDDTIVMVVSDNGASAEGGPSGNFSEFLLGNGHRATDDENMPFLDRWGGPETYPHYSFAWAVAGNTPFRYYKMTTHEGGTHVPLIMSWPKGIAARGELRNQFTYVTDLASTILAMTGVAQPQNANNASQLPLHGQSLVSTFSNAVSPESRTQYFELYGNKALWSDGWLLATTHRYKTWEMAPKPVDEPWELYNLAIDPGQTRDLAATDTQRVTTMSRMFDDAAKRFGVAPISDISEAQKQMAQKAQAALARRGGVWRYAGPVTRVGALDGPPIFNRSYVATADIRLTSDKETGVIFSHGSVMGGAAFYLRSGQPVFAMRSLDGKLVTVAAEEKLAAGSHALSLRVNRNPEQTIGEQDVEVTISADGRTVTSQTVKAAMPLHGMFDFFNVGLDDGGTVSPQYPADEFFPGGLRNVVFDFSEKRKAP